MPTVTLTIALTLTATASTFKYSYKAGPSVTDIAAETHLPPKSMYISLWNISYVISVTPN